AANKIEEHAPHQQTRRPFWKCHYPGNYHQTVKRTEDAFQACNDIVACFQERARVERQYAQQLSEWSTKWKPLVDASPLYGSLLRAWQCFLSSADRLSSLHSSICRSLVSEDGDRIRTWQKETFHKKIFGGFKESQDFETGFSRAQKPWAKRLKKLEKAKSAFHKACRKEHMAREREAHAQGNPDIAIEKQRKIQEETELAHQETEKVRARYEKILEEVTRYAPRYMEEMESIFDQSQEEERKRISFLKQAFLSIHRHLDVTNNERCVRTVILYWSNLKWINLKMLPCVFLCGHVMIGGVRVRALYDYAGQETDELSFKAGEEFLKIEDEDDQGWCRGMMDGGKEGLYPANYVEVV
uniref:Si:ch211-51c14.1 n=1 Tax=Cyprinus carpio TaxID=7962 RepID=A0A8C2DA00_CYPCA